MKVLLNWQLNITNNIHAIQSNVIRNSTVTFFLNLPLGLAIAYFSGKSYILILCKEEKVFHSFLHSATTK